MARCKHHNVCVVKLSKDVLFEGKIKKCNPNYMAGKLCVYEGMTGLEPDLRFDKHKAGIQSKDALNNPARNTEAGHLDLEW